MTEPISRRTLLAGTFASLAAIGFDRHSSFAADSTPFRWALGIEDTFIPDERPGLRALEEYTLTQHYQQWHSDLDKIASMGVHTIRWGIPWYKVEPSRGKFDWSWTDQVLAYMIDELRIDPILDLIHYGTPSWLPQAFLDREYPQYAADYSDAVMQRYGKKIKYYTPMNEPTVAGDFALRRGKWPPYAQSESAYAQGMLQIARGIQTVTQAIRRSHPDAVIVAVEALRKYKTASAATPSGLIGDLQAWDLSRGVVDGAHPLHQYFVQNGVSEEQLASLRQEPVRQDILGVNFYPWSVESTGKNNTQERAAGSDLKALLEQAYGYAKVPLFVTETSSGGGIEVRKKWMDETVESVRKARQQGIRVQGYTWFPAFPMINWDYRKSVDPLARHIMDLGLYDGELDEKGVLVRKETPLVAMYAQLAKSSEP